MKYWYTKALTVTCDYCGAKWGQPCLTKPVDIYGSGKVQFKTKFPHKLRTRKAGYREPF